jgi:hypothetical protein
MRVLRLSSLIAIVAATAWCVFAGFWLYPYREPLVGFGPRDYKQAMCFQLALAGAFILLIHYRWRVPAGVIGLVALVFVLPLPSKAGVVLQFENNTSTPGEITIARTDDPKRRVRLSVPANERISYRTAPGDYSDGLAFAMESGTRRLTAAVFELRRSEVHLSETNLWLGEPKSK